MGGPREGLEPLRVLLVNPPRFHELIGKNPALVERHRGHNPPLGLLQLAGYVERHTSHRVEVLDAQPDGITYSQLERELAGRQFDVLGVTAMTFTLTDVRYTCRVAKKVKPHVPVVLGGVHVHLYPNETIAWPEVDFLIQGEGEIAFADFLNKLRRPDLHATVDGLVYTDPSGTVRNNGIAPSTDDLDQLGMPAREKVDVRKYTSLLGRHDVVTTMFTSRGCPYRCTFCDRPNSPVTSGFRWRSAKNVADEMERCVDLGIREAFIYDDTFTVRKDRVYELCDEIRKRRIHLAWDVRAHVNTVTRGMLRSMAEAGCDRIHFGVEVGNERMMRVIRKNHTIERVENAFRWAREAGLERLAYAIIGQQTEGAEDIRDTMTLVRRIDPDYVLFTIFCPYPGTEIYAQGLERGIIEKDVWGEFAREPRSDFELPVWEENFTRAQLREMLVKCYKSFYMRPGYVFRRVRQLRSLGELGRKLRAAMSVVWMSPNERVFTRRVAAAAHGRPGSSA